MKTERYAALSMATALATMALKALAYELTGSVGLLSDALESVVNLAAAALAWFALREAKKPADVDHAFGHEKAEYFASGAEGALILVAAAGIFWEALQRFLHPRPVEQLGWGLVVSGVASLLNLAVAQILLRAGRRHDSIALEADGHHLMTDVWTSVGVLVGLGLVAVVGVSWLDPVVAMAVALHIVFSGVDLLKRSGRGLLDGSIDPREKEAIEGVLRAFAGVGVHYKGLRTRLAGPRRFVEVTLLVPGRWTVSEGHARADEVEAAIREKLPRAHVVTHMEPIEKERSVHPVSGEPSGAP